MDSSEAALAVAPARNAVNMARPLCVVFGLLSAATTAQEPPQAPPAEHLRRRLDTPRAQLGSDRQPRCDDLWQHRDQIYRAKLAAHHKALARGVLSRSGGRMVERDPLWYRTSGRWDLYEPVWNCESEEVLPPPPPPPTTTTTTL